jgi:hypothetical protein
VKAWYKKNHRRTLSAAVIVRSPEAKLTLQYLHDLAGESDAAGLLLDNGRPYTTAQIVAFTGLNIKKQQLALEELQFHGLIQKRGDGAIEVLGWNDDQTTKEALRKRTQRGTCPTHGVINCGTCPRENAPKHVTCPDKEYIDTSTPTVDKSPSGVADARPPEWVQSLLGRVREIWRTSLEKLSPDELRVLAQYHCLLFANCTKSESNNLSNATKVAVGLAKLASSRDFGDMTVAVYVRYGQKVHEQRKRMRWFDPFYIRSVVEFERA